MAWHKKASVRVAEPIRLSVARKSPLRHCFLPIARHRNIPTVLSLGCKWAAALGLAEAAPWRWRGSQTCHAPIIQTAIGDLEITYTWNRKAIDMFAFL
jgi:hypothetical protein